MTPGFEHPGHASSRALLIRNPVARHRLTDEQLARMQGVAAAAGWRLESVATDQAGAATALAREAAARGLETVIVYGGDGTLNEAINGLAGTATAAAVVRGGTANVWAKETGVPKDPVKAMAAIVGGERRVVDLGRANGRYFLCMAGAGLDACIVENVSGGMKRRLGALAYVLAGVWTVFATKPWQTPLAVDGARSRTPLYWLLAGNTRSYGGMVQLTHRALVDDGMLDMALMRRGNALRLLRDGMLALARRHERSPNLTYTRARTIEITAPGIPLQLDGEACGETPAVIECVPAALTVIVPRGLRSPLFGSAATSCEPSL